MQNELDKNLRALFEEKSRGLPDEPFLSNTLQLIEKRQSRRILKRNLVFVIGFALCAVLSPFLVKGSMALSDGLNTLFGALNGFVNTPTGMTIAALCALLLLLFNRRRIYRFV